MFGGNVEFIVSFTSNCISVCKSLSCKISRTHANACELFLNPFSYEFTILNGESVLAVSRVSNRYSKPFIVNL